MTVRGGYSPELIHTRQGVPLEIEFDRQESGECTNRVVFADLGVNAGPPAYTKTTVRLGPTGRHVQVCLRHEHDPRHPRRRPADETTA